MTARALSVAAALAMAGMAHQAGAARSDPVDVRHQAVNLTLDLSARQARGHTTLTLQARSTLRQLALDAGHLHIDRVALEDGTELPFTYDGGSRDGGLQVTLDRAYGTGDRLNLRIDYRTRWVNHSDPQALWGSVGRGLRFFRPGAADARKRHQVWAGQTPGTLRYWVPGLDAAHLWRTTELAVTVPAGLTAVSGGRARPVTSHGDGTRTFRWRTDTPHAPHRLALVVGDFVDVPQAAEGVALHNLAYPDEVQATADSVVQLPDMVRWFNALTGTALPGPSYTQVFVQDLPWGQVGPGLAVQTENMVDDHGTHADFRYLWDGLQAESLAAQWFGVLMTACDARHTWLDRGLAHHLAALYAEHQDGRDEALLWIVQADQATARADDESPDRLPLVPAALADPATFAEGNVPWARGAAVLHALRHELGDETWRRVLRHHVRQNAGHPVCTDDFRRAAESASGRDLGWFFDQWMHRAGHPTFDVSWQHDAATGHVTVNVRQTQPEPYGGTLDVEVDGHVHRVRLQPQAGNRFTLAAPTAPRWVHVDPVGAWLMTLRTAQPAAELLQQLRHTPHAASRQWAMTELARRARAADAPPALRDDLEAALRELALDRRLYWRVRFQALGQLRAVLAPSTAGQPVVMKAATLQALRTIVDTEATWLRASALAALGLTRDPAHAGVYLQHLRDPSDRVINSAAIALGQSGSPLALDALLALPAHPSWKNQSLISALAGLKELRDARGATLARRALADVRSPRWTLSTPVWDYRLAAAQTLVALGQGAGSVPLLLTQFAQALDEGDVNDLFSTALLLATLGDERARPALATLRQRFAGHGAALKATDDLQAQLEAAIRAASPAKAP